MVKNLWKDFKNWEWHIAQCKQCRYLNNIHCIEHTQSVLELSFSMKNSKSETAIKKNFILKSRIVKALLPYYMMGIVFIGAVEYA